MDVVFGRVEVFSAIRACRIATSKAETICAPVARSAEMRKIRFSQMTGELWPMPGSGCFQRKLAGSHLVGMRVVVALAGAVGAAEAVPVFGVGTLRHREACDKTTHKNVSRKGAERERSRFNHEGTKDTKIGFDEFIDSSSSFVTFVSCVFVVQLLLLLASSRLCVRSIVAQRSMWYCSILRYSVARPMPSSLAASGTLSPVRLRASVIRRFSHSSMQQRFQLAAAGIAEGQVVRPDRVFVGQHDGAIEHVAKLPHVAGPAIGEQLLRGPHRSGRGSAGRAGGGNGRGKNRPARRCRRRGRGAAACAARTR